MAGQHVQLAVYAEAVRQQLGPTTEVAATFWFVTGQGEFRRWPSGFDPSAADQRLAEALAVIADGIQQGDFPAVPGAESQRDFENCARCAYTRVCPTGRDQLFELRTDDPAYVRYRRLRRENESE